MIVEGNIVVCVDTNIVSSAFASQSNPLTEGKQYHVHSILSSDQSLEDNRYNYRLLMITNDNNIGSYYNADMFITLEEYRENIINNILK